mmetsp:Transcript_49221/g.101540  ORF Transcript_49221/g.101540 Transcript_49221/m.101540 type:complete len:218 (-) Transcript_49221:35-688(-)
MLVSRVCRYWHLCSLLCSAQWLPLLLPIAAPPTRVPGGKAETGLNALRDLWGAAPKGERGRHATTASPATTPEAQGSTCERCREGDALPVILVLILSEYRHGGLTDQPAAHGHPIPGLNPGALHQLAGASGDSYQPHEAGDVRLPFHPHFLLLRNRQSRTLFCRSIAYMPGCLCTATVRLDSRQSHFCLDLPFITRLDEAEAGCRQSLRQHWRRSTT